VRFDLGSSGSHGKRSEGEAAAGLKFIASSSGLNKADAPGRLSPQWNLAEMLTGASLLLRNLDGIRKLAMGFETVLQTVVPASTHCGHHAIC
jgi:hypothetical protein